MARRYLYLGVGLVTALVIAYAVYAGLKREESVYSVDRVAGGIDAWPLQTCWQWRIKGLLPEKKVGIVLRGIREEITPGIEPAFPSAHRKINDKDAITSSSTGWLVLGRKGAETARVVCQAIDIGQLGLDADMVKKPLRLLLSLNIGGSTSPLTGERAIVEGDYFAAIGPSHFEQKWEDGELPLMNVYTRSKQSLFIYEVVLKQRPLD